MTENELEGEIIAICEKPRKELGIYRKTKQKFAELKRKDFHNILLKLIFRGSLEATVEWRLQKPNEANIHKPPA